MQGWAALITAIAALVGALAGPVAVATLLLVFRESRRSASRDRPAVGEDAEGKAGCVRRFRRDDPFLFFQAATVLRSIANLRAGTDPAVTAAAKEGLGIVRAFPGQPDRNTIDVLVSIAAGNAA